MRELHVTTRGRGAGEVAEVEAPDEVLHCEGCALSYGDEAAAQRVAAGTCKARPCGARPVDRRDLARRQRLRKARDERAACLDELAARILRGDVADDLATSELRKALRTVERCDAAIMANRDPTPAERAEADFHRSRRAFFLTDAGPHLIPERDARSHRMYAGARRDGEALMRCPRGFAHGGRLVVYQLDGRDYFADTPEAEASTRHWLRSLAGLLNLDGATSVELGSVPQEPGGAWPSRRVLGSVDDLLAGEGGGEGVGSGGDAGAGQ